jgi:hypothetical protein
MDIMDSKISENLGLNWLLIHGFDFVDVKTEAVLRKTESFGGIYNNELLTIDGVSLIIDSIFNTMESKRAPVPNDLIIQAVGLVKQVSNGIWELEAQRQLHLKLPLYVESATGHRVVLCITVIAMKSGDTFNCTVWNGIKINSNIKKYARV